MTSPTLELQGAIVSTLKGAAIAGGRVYDSIPSHAAFPYVSLGPSDELPDDAECITGFDISMQIDCWSRKPGFPEVRGLAEAVRVTLHRAELPITDNALVLFQHRQTRFLRDPDGLTSHAALTFMAIVEQP